MYTDTKERVGLKSNIVLFSQQMVYFSLLFFDIYICLRKSHKLANLFDYIRLGDVVTQRHRHYNIQLMSTWT